MFCKPRVRQSKPSKSYGGLQTTSECVAAPFYACGLQTAVALVHIVAQVDLAGHENEKTTRVTGDRLRELSFINTTLFHLRKARPGSANQRT